MWSIEQIPDPDKLYFRVHDNDVRKGNIMPGAFRERGEGDQKGMSTDWGKYSTVAESLSRAKVAAKNNIVSFITGVVRQNSLIVEHAPIEENRAHTNIKSLASDEQRRLKLLNIYNWEHKNSASH